MSTDQKRARWFGVLYLITFATSIPALGLFQPVLDDPVGYIASGGHDKQVLFGALFADGLERGTTGGWTLAGP